MSEALSLSLVGGDVFASVICVCSKRYDDDNFINFRLKKEINPINLIEAIKDGDPKLCISIGIH
jgi:hypothetical protein